MNKQIERPTDRWTGRHTQLLTDRHTDRYMGRNIDIGQLNEQRDR